MTAEVAEFLPTLRQPLERNLDPEDEVLVLTDTVIDDAIATALLAAGRSLGHETTLFTMVPRSYDNADPPPPAAAAMAAADLFVLVISTSLAHSAPASAAQRDGSKMIEMSGLSPGILRDPIATVDFDELTRRARVLGDLLEAGTEIRVTDPGGTDLRATITDRKVWRSDGTVTRTPTSYGTTFPAGEVGVCPREGTTSGTVVWDTTVHGIGRLDSPIEFRVEDGWVTDIEGGAAAETFRRRLDDAGDANARYCAAEIAIGINPAARITGELRTDKKVLGTVHVATGDNVALGGEVESNLHVDGVIERPTVDVDGDRLVEDGSLVVGEWD